MAKLLIESLHDIDVYKRIVALPIGKSAYREISYREIAFKGNCI